MSAAISASPFSLGNVFSGKKLHLGVSGSVACYKALDLLRAWRKTGIEVSATLTAGARRFVSPLLFRSLGASPVYGDLFEKEEEVFAHLEPGRNADAMILAPATAAIISRLANGDASDMLSTQALAFDGPVVLAPAMNPRMWANAATQANVKSLAGRGICIVPPGTGLAACGDEGQGRLAEEPEIFLAGLKALSTQDMRGLKVMVTLGPTREPWDGVRFWSNPSSGRMGAALATCAWLRGAEVTAICGPVADVFLPSGIRRLNVESAGEMLAASQKAWPEMDLGLFCAAVSDFAPVRPAGAEGAKAGRAEGQQGMNVEFVLNPDIIATLAASARPGQKILGFAAEICPDMRSLLPLASRKLAKKKAHIIAANRVNPEDCAFGADLNSMAVVDRTGREEIWSPQSKADVAWELCTWLLKM